MKALFKGMAARGHYLLTRPEHKWRQNTDLIRIAEFGLAV